MVQSGLAHKAAKDPVPLNFRSRHLSIRDQLLLLALAIVLPVAALLAWHVADDARQARVAAYARLKLVADDTAVRIERILDGQEAVLARLAARPRVRALDPRNCDPMIWGYLSLHPEFTTLAVRDLRGNAICSFNPHPPGQAQIAGLAWFQEGLRNGKFSISDAYRGQSSGRWLSVLTYPIHDEQGEVSGLIGLAIDLMKLNERVFAHASADAGQMVLDRDGRFLLRSVDAAEWIGKPLPDPQAGAIRARTADFFSARDVSGVQRLHFTAAVPGTGWRVFASLPEDEVFADYRATLQRSIAVGLVALLVVLVLARRISLAIARPIGELAATAERIAGGEQGARARVSGPTEVEQVARQFNRMLDTLERQREERAALVHHIESLFRQARDMILLVGPTGDIVEANDAAVAAYGYSADELLGMNVRDLRTQKAQAVLERDWQGAAGPLGVLFETEHRRRDGSTFPVEVSAQSIEVDGKLYRQSFIRDISERRAAEMQIHHLNRAYATLSETNQAIVRVRSQDELFPRICRIAVEFGGYLCAWVGLPDEANRRIAPAVVVGEISDYVRQIHISTDAAVAEGRGPTALALREGRPTYCQDFLHDPATEPWREAGLKFGVRSSAALPLRRAGAVIGTLNLYSTEPGIFDASVRSLLEEMAFDVSFALDKFDRDAAHRRAEESLAQSEARFRSILEQNVSAIFMIEDGRLSYVNRRTAAILGYSPEELVGKRMLDLVAAPDRAGLVDATQRLLSGELGTVERNFGALRKDGTIAEIGANVIVATVQGKKTILGMGQDIGERKKAQAEIDHYVARLERSMESTLQAVSSMVELRDPYTAGHERNVGELAAAIGAEMGLPATAVKGLRLAGYVHDLGKVSVPAEILSKPSRLTSMELELIKGHPQSGYDVLKHVDFPWPVAEIILQHHERLDGSGYPRQLKGAEILPEARIMAVADVVEAMSSHRPYRPGFGMHAALAEIEGNSGRFYDAEVVAACLRLFRDKGFTLPD